MKKLIFKWPEQLLLGYAVLMLALLVGMSTGRMISCGIVFEALAMPVGLLLELVDWPSLLPDGLLYFVVYLASLANGVLFYSLLKLALRQLHPGEEEPIQASETTRGK